MEFQGRLIMIHQIVSKEFNIPLDKDKPIDRKKKLQDLVDMK